MNPIDIRGQKYLKGSALVLKGLEMVYSGAAMKFEPLKTIQVQAAFSLLPPIANGLNALCGFMLVSNDSFFCLPPNQNRFATLETMVSPKREKVIQRRLSFLLGFLALLS